MKFLIIHHFGGIGGGTISCLDIATMLIAGGHKVAIAIPDPCQDVIDTCKIKGITLIPAEVPPVMFTYHNASGNAIREIIKYVLLQKNTKYWKELISSAKPDIVVLNSMAQIPMVAVTHKLQMKTICFVRETIRGSQASPLNQLISTQLNRCDCVTFLTEYDCCKWELSSKVPKYVVPDVVDLERFSVQKKTTHLLKQHYDISDSNHVILYFGGISYEKGCLELLKAFSMVSKKKSDAVLVIAGSKNEELLIQRGLRRLMHQRTRKYVLTCMQLIEELKAHGAQIRDIGITSSTSELYSICDMVVFPVKTVHQARPVYEAGLFNKPVIVPECPNFRESVIDGYNGLTYKLGDVDSLAHAIILMLENDEISLQYGKANNKMYDDKHSFEKGKDAFSRAISSIAIE